MIKKTRLPNGKIQVTFSVTPNGNAEKVSLVGEFNRWDAMANPMVLQGPGEHSSWSVTLELDADSKYQFCYLIDSNQWVPDEAADGLVSQANGISHSVLNLEKDGLPVAVKHPYANTPYDVLSDPEVGIISLNSPKALIRQQKTKMMARHKIDPHLAAEMADRLAGMKRLDVDVFLYCTFDLSQDVNRVIEHHGDPVIPEVKAWDLIHKLPYWRDVNIPKITLDELNITHSSVYDDPRLDLQTVDFDL